MSHKILPLLVVISLGLNEVFAQRVPFLFSPVVTDACQIGTVITSTADLDWAGVSCVDAELDASGTSIAFTSQGVNERIFGSPTWHTSVLNQLPGAPGEVGFLDFQLVGDLDKLDLLEGVFAVFVLTDDTLGIQVIQENFLPISLGCNELLVNGNSTISIAGFQFTMKDDVAPGTAVNLGITYSYTPSLGNSTIDEILVPEADFNGTTYEHDLPLGLVNVSTRTGSFFIGLEENKPDQQIININKSEGVLAVDGWVNVELQRSTQTNEYHDVRLNLEGVSICLESSEFTVDRGATLVLGNSSISYDNQLSCLGAHAAGKIVIKAGTTQVMGEGGFGMYLFADDAILKVEENARLILDNTFFMETTAATYLDIAPGASVEVTESARVYSLGLPETIKVRVQQGGSFDMSSAPLDVQRLFSVEQVSGTQNFMPAGSYVAFPNPATEGKVYIRSGIDAPSLGSVEVIDLAGRLRAQILPAPNLEIIPVQLPESGMFIIRMTDVDGRVGHLKVVSE